MQLTLLGIEADCIRVRCEGFISKSYFPGTGDPLEILLGPLGFERKVLLSLEEAIHELTDVPARLYGLRGRGRVLDGWCADVVVFDPERIDNGPMRTQTDLPGGASRLFADARGVEHVIVNGREIVAQGELTGAVPGTLLRSGRDTTTVEAAGTPVYASG